MFQATTFQVALIVILQISSSLESCGRPADIPDGFVSYESLEKGSSATYSCHPGYVLRGTRSRVCSERGWWGQLPECQLKSCGSLRDILNGWFTASGNVFGANVTFHCNEGFSLRGVGHSRCEVNGWSGTVPTCETVRCAAPPSIQRGDVSDLHGMDRWEYGMVATYSCHSLYTLIGQKEIYCSASGNWSHPPPTCKVVRCDSPEPPANSHVMSGFGFGLKYGDMITYRCGVGYDMIGSGVIECSEDNQFHPAPPTCNLTGCNQIYKVLHGWIENEQPVYARHDPVRYRCHRGYKLTGSETIRCTGRNEFDVPAPTCQRIPCAKPSRFHNGEITPDRRWYAYGDEVTFRCATGYRVIGEDRGRCSDDGTFHPSPPRCERVPCAKPSRFHNGEITPDRRWYAYGDEVTFRCAPGYRVIGEDRGRCSDDGTFHPSPPRCERVPCAKPSRFHNGEITPDRRWYAYGDEVTFRCAPGYRVIGEDRGRCSDDGTFHPSPPRCERVTCARPSSFHNRDITPDRRWYACGDEVTFSCATGYRVIGEDKGRCSDDGTFHPSPPWCEREPSPSRILTIRDLMKVIVPKARDILEEMKSIIKLERQLLQKEETVSANFREIFQHFEQFVNSTHIIY
ncbi:C4b-binding protein alpha chain-like [Rhinoraja longicauda]